ncbi:MAG: hypothetical protein IT179_01885 [Acidobacteria bacterium]|nr:hypothetical protein [Acidobacteriota bacterium]
MNWTVDLVIAGDGNAARAAAVSALRRGQRVLLVLGSAEVRVARRLRRILRGTADANGCQLHVVTNAEVVCVDGISAVEAVVIRHAATGRLSAVNASASISCDGQTNEYDARRD